MDITKIEFSDIGQSPVNLNTVADCLEMSVEDMINTDKFKNSLSASKMDFQKNLTGLMFYDNRNGVYYADIDLVVIFLEKYSIIDALKLRAIYNDLFCED